MTALRIDLDPVDVIDDDFDHSQRVDAALDGLALRPAHVEVDRAPVPDIDGDLGEDIPLPLGAKGVIIPKARGVDEELMAAAQVDEVARVAV